jgi:hypothetical protein
MTVIASADAVEKIAGSDLHRACEFDDLLILGPARRV